MTAKTLKTSLMALVITCFAGTAPAQQTFSGEIMDDLCGKDKTHAKMMEQMKSMTSDPVVCTKKCVQLGAHYVLLDRQKGTMYRIENPEKAEPFAGKTVQVSGSVEKNKLKISTIEAIGGAK